MKRPTHPTPLPIFVSLPPISTSDFSRYPTTSSTTSLSDSFSSKTTTVYDFIGQVDEAAAAEHREPLTSQFSLLSKRAPAYSGPTTTISRHLQKSKSAGLQKSSSAQYRRSGSESSRFRKRAVSISHSLASPVPLDFQHVKLSPMLLDIQPAKESTPPTIFKRPVPRSLKRVAVSSTFPTQTAALHPGIPSYQAAERRPSAPAMMLSTSAGNFHRSLSSQSGMRKFSLDLAASPEHVPLKDDKGIILMDPNAAERVCLGLGSGSDKADKLLGINNETCRALPVRSVKKVPSWKIKSFGNFKSVLNNMTGVASKERKKVREEWERRQMNISHPIDVHRV
ncbi:hypothetical protein SARC_02461 [Sphaeroforma arctica JP610]|uniref:Uncharacterized protein n=1 Tax=Sphaeroforma arctica JP610 TaxID=667725 RepID=A0A0L0G915_9EUKA|nr:hypothetical protein SARC_02461 [Sphaeroforma arctica JP610]KNC85371.1 hypothetical protein SARC_02461 [Sphaeroforma arctica JP610]|eukprot:XP_014159273.1 hypothetical protein SARC_02461 [Sphaeroforma arctica JP610]